MGTESDAISHFFRQAKVSLVRHAHKQSNRFSIALTFCNLHSAH